MKTFRSFHTIINRITAGDLKRVPDRRENLIYSGFTALISSLFLGLICPLQLYVQTHEFFHFTIWNLLSACLIIFFTLLLTIFLLLFLSRRMFGFLIHILLLIIILYFALETGILSYGLPELDGNLANYANPARTILDSTIALILLLLPFFFYTAFRKRIFSLGIFIVILSTAYFVEIQANNGQDPEKVFTTVPRHQVVQNLSFAEKNNVIVLIVDAISTEVVEDVLNDHAGLKTKLPGFVNFTNNVGMHVQTSVALPGIFSGGYLSVPSELPFYSNEVYSSSSFIKNYLDENSMIFVSLLLPDFSYTNARVDTSENLRKSNFLKSFTVRMEGMFPWNMIEYYSFKIAPYLFKKDILEKFIRQWEVQKDKTPVHVGDAMVYGKLAEAPVDKSIQSTLHVHHVKGGHPPILFDENGKRIEHPRKTYRAYYNRVHFEFKRIIRLLDRLRERGLYDDAFIVILGDHGIHILDTPKAKGVPNNAFPAIMVKNRNATGEFINSNIPTSHSKIANMMKEIADKNLTETEIANILKCDNRLYRQASNTLVYDFIIDKDYNVEFKQREIVKDPLKLKPLKIKQKYLFRNYNNPLYPDFITNGRRTSGMGLDFSSNRQGELIFRLPKSNCRYSLRFTITPFGLSTGHNGTYLFISENFKKEHFLKSKEDILMSDISTDNNGILHLQIEPRNANYSLCFLSLLVKESSP